MDKMMKRKPNFTEIEVKNLLRAVQKRPELITTDSILSKEEIRDGWLKIEKNFASVAVTERTAEDLRLKFADLKSRTKKKILDMKRYGTRIHLSMNEKLVFNLTNENAENGMFEFVDTFNTETSATRSPKKSPSTSPMPSPRYSPAPVPVQKKKIKLPPSRKSPPPPPPTSSPSPPSSPESRPIKRKREPIILFTRTKKKISDDKDEQLIEIARRQAEAAEQSNVLSEQRNALLAELIDVLKSKFVRPVKL